MSLRATSTFTVSDWTPLETPTTVGGTDVPATAASSGVAQMTKTFAGGIRGRSATWFLGCLNQATGTGTYAALEALDVTVGDRSGTFNLVHAASTHGTDRYDEHLVVVPGSGTGGFVGITGTGSVVVDADGTHRLTLDFELGE